VTSPTKMLFATLALSAGLSGTGVVYAADDATFNQCWGQTTEEFAQMSDSQPGIGEHSQDPPGFEPGEGGREGVGNVSEDDPDFGTPLSEGGQGVHANFVGDQMGLPECDGPPVP
jgi:hypothetical protein